MDHRVNLPGGYWAAWRCVELRGAGFAAHRVLRLGAPQLAIAAGAVLEAESIASDRRREVVDALRSAIATGPPDLRSAYTKARRHVSKGRVPDLPGTEMGPVLRNLTHAYEDLDQALAAYRASFERAANDTLVGLREEAGDPRFQEAMIWQNRGAYEGVILPLLREGRFRHPHNDALLVASYLQRYCVKNDIIGFFGPAGWVRIVDEAGTIDVRPGQSLLLERSVHFEQWAIDALAEAIAKKLPVEPWVPPRRLPFVSLDGDAAVVMGTSRQVLSPQELAVFTACDGVRTAKHLVAALVSERSELFAGEQVVLDTLAGLRAKGLIQWRLELPLEWNPEGALRRMLARIEDASVRAPALQPLEDLECARDAVASAAGDPETLPSALARLDATFTSVTGKPPTRRAGAMYAARGLVFEDARRDMHMTLGRGFLEALTPPLSLLLMGTRWATCEVAKTYRELFHGLYGELAGSAGADSLPFLTFWLRAQRLLLGRKDRPIDRVIDSLKQRWAELLDLTPGLRRAAYTSADLAHRVAEAFRAPGPGWPSARHHSPDLMIAARDVDAVRRGEFELVLGELHASENTFDIIAALKKHPAPEELLGAMRADVPEPRILWQSSKDWPRVTVRNNRALIGRHDYALMSGMDPPPLEPPNVLPLADLVLKRQGGELRVFGPRGEPDLEIIDFFGSLLSHTIAPGWSLLPRMSHQPRVSIDRLVVAREAWSFALSELDFARQKEPRDRFLGARRWAKLHDLPRFLFVKAPFETKPMYLDLESPIYVEMLAKLVRRAHEQRTGTEIPLTFTEMYPSFDQIWLPDAAGNRYTSELRVIAVDLGG